MCEVFKLLAIAYLVWSLTQGTALECACRARLPADWTVAFKAIRTCTVAKRIIHSFFSAQDRRPEEVRKWGSRGCCDVLWALSQSLLAYRDLPARIANAQQVSSSRLNQVGHRTVPGCLKFIFWNILLGEQFLAFGDEGVRDRISLLSMVHKSMS